MAEQDERVASALESTSPKDLRNALKDICKKNPTFQQQFLRGLAEHEKEKQRKMRQKWKPCDRCGLVACTSKDTNRRCRYHPGEIEEFNSRFSWRDEEFWPEGYDEEDNQEEYPFSWSWSCCEGLVESAGCERPAKEKAKMKKPELAVRQVDKKPQATRQRLENHPYGRANLKLVAVPDAEHDPSKPKEGRPGSKAAVKRLPVGAKGYNHPYGRLNLKLVAGTGSIRESPQEGRPAARAPHTVSELPLPALL
ncbi:hypothetical protein B0T16DRAFT_395346 [Cercophora newfieldiana]|uniref:Uncharacterized protein n=1 Tax=Cercophora newfieldiana TaxID=92897 RepID=A0AA39XUH7_9PEZI|nr:hypothetical protein B0T16DRAFT_395346 [Cercophora newfieldiana]